jgi:hypothetical protein
MLVVLRLILQWEVIMGIPHDGKEKSENLTRRKRMKRSEQKKRPPRKGEKNKPLLQLTIPSRRRKGKK